MSAFVFFVIDFAWPYLLSSGKLDCVNHIAKSGKQDDRSVTEDGQKGGPICGYSSLMRLACGEDTKHIWLCAPG